MSIGAAIYSRLTDPVAAAALAALVGDRIYPDLAEEEQPWPQVVIDEGDIEPDVVSGKATIESAAVTVSAIGLTKQQAADVAAAVRGILHNQAGTWDGCEVQGAFVQDQQDRVEKIDKDTRYYVRELEFKVWYRPL